MNYKIWDGTPPSSAEEFVAQCPEYPLEIVQWYFDAFVMKLDKDWTKDDLLEFLLINGPARLKVVMDIFGPERNQPAT